jgi:excisionase family DNA binding protein
MKSRQTRFAAGRKTASSRQHKLHLSASSLPLETSRLSMKSCEGEPQLAPTVATAEKLQSFFTEPNKGAKDGKRKSAAKDFSATLKNGKQNLAFRPAEAAECLLNVSGAARFLAVSVSTLYGWVWQRRIPFVKAGRALRFEMSDLRRFVEENRIPAKTAQKL